MSSYSTLIFLSLLTALTFSTSSASTEVPVDQERIARQYDRSPVMFEENIGQHPAEVRFTSRAGNSQLFLTDDEAVVTMSSADQRAQSVVRFKLAGAARAQSFGAAEETAAKVNYFRGNDPAKWQRNARTFSRVNLSQVYPGIDLTYYGNQEQLEYDFIVAPGVDYRQIGFEISGADHVEVDPSGDLVLHTDAGEFRQKKPFTYQKINGIRREISSSYALENEKIVRFQVGAYDAQLPLVIDPIMTFFTYLEGGISGSGSQVSVQGVQGMKVDLQGNVYLCGIVDTTDFPVRNALRDTHNGATVFAHDSFVAKFDSQGELLFSTYFGGQSGSNDARSLALDNAGNIYVAGWTTSTDFPTTINGVDNAKTGESADAFLTKLSNDGNAILYSTFFGGTRNDYCYAVDVDQEGHAYLTGHTYSTNLPVTPNRFQTAFSPAAGNSDNVEVFVAEIDTEPASCTPDATSGLSCPESLVYSTLLGGGDGDEGFAIRVASPGIVWVAGSADTGFPTKNAYQATLTPEATVRGTGGFIAKINTRAPKGTEDAARNINSAESLLSSTFFGDGGGYLRVLDLVLDGSSNVIVSGATVKRPGKFPLLNAFDSDGGPFFNNQSYPSIAPEAFVAKFNSSCTSLVFSTYLGGNDDEMEDTFPLLGAFLGDGGLAVDTTGNIYVTGTTHSTDFPLLNILPNGGTHHGGTNAKDAFVVMLRPSGAGIVSSYLGGNGDEQAAAIEIDRSRAPGTVYIGGITRSADIATVPPRTPKKSPNSSGAHHAAFITRLALQSSGDTTPPTVVITSPAHQSSIGALTSIIGTARDDLNGVGMMGAVGFTLYQNGDFWDGTQWSPTQVLLFAEIQPNGSWTYTQLPTGGNARTGEYAISATAYDNADNASVATSGVNNIIFRIDAEAPKVTITSPAHGSILSTAGYSFNGTATDSSGISGVVCFIRRQTDNFYWNGSGWIAEPLLANLAASYDGNSNTWNCTATLPQPGPGFSRGNYTFIALATDATGRSTQNDSVVTFDDNAPPSVRVTAPRHYSAYQAGVTSISGTATDASGIQNNKVQLTLLHEATGEYWNGAAWLNTATVLEAPVNGSGGWTYTSVPTGGNVRAGKYKIRASARDGRGTPSVEEFTLNHTEYFIDNTPPTVSIGSPANGSRIETLNYRFEGAATDPVGIERVVLFIQRGADGQFWNGTGWVPNALNENLGSVYDLNNLTWASVFTVAPDGNRLPMPGPDPATQLTNGNYTFFAIAYDRAGNTTQTESAVTVDYFRKLVWTRGSFTDGVAGNDNDQWGNAANWAVDGVIGALGIPGAGDFAVIELGHAITSETSRTVAKFRMTAGSLGFPTAGTGLTITKGGVWTGGTLSRVDIGSGATFEISGAAMKDIVTSGVINNFGVATWMGPGVVRGLGSSQWNNKPGSSFAIAADGPVFTNFNGNNKFTNEGNASLLKTAGASDSSSQLNSWTYDNAGSIGSAQGTLTFGSTLNLNDGASFTGSGRVLLSGTTNVTARVTSTGRPELIGTLNGSNPSASFSGTNPFNWSAGAINGSFTLAAGSVLELTTTAMKDLNSSAVFHNFGRVTWTGGGLLRGVGSSVFNNEAGAIFHAATDGTIFTNFNGNNVFNNKAGAVFTKSGQSGVLNAESLVNSWTFNNSGTIRSDDGLLRFNTVLNLNDGGSISRGGTLPAQVLSSSSLVLTGTTTVSNITFQNSGDWIGNIVPGTAGNGTIATTGSGVFEWTAGGAQNVVSVAPGSTWLITGETGKDIKSSSTVNNYGNATWSGTGVIRGVGSSTLKNFGTFTAASDADFTNFNTSNKFINAPGAMFQKHAGPDDNRCDWAFHNEGTLLAATGAIAMNGGGISNGTFVGTGTGVIQFAGGQHDLVTTAAFEGSTKIQVTGGTLRAADELQVSGANGRLEIVGGMVTSAAGASFNILGNMSWTGGTIGGLFNLKPGSFFEISGPATKDVASSGVINNSGAATWSGPGAVRGIGSSRWNNKPGSSFAIATDGNVFTVVTGNNRFTNEAGATLLKTAGAGDSATTLSGWTYDNAGSIGSAQGTLTFGSTLNLNDGASFTGSGRVLMSGTTNVTAQINSTGRPELIGTLNGSNPSAGFSGTNPFNWSAGAINGSFTLAAGSVLELTTGAIKDLNSSAVFHNYGRVTWTGGGLLRGVGSSVFNNEAGAIFNAATDGTIFTNFNGNNVFSNKAGAVFTKSGQSGVLNAESLVNSWTFNNSGTIRSDDGLLRFNSLLNLNDGGAISRAGALPAQVASTSSLFLTGTTTVSNLTFQNGGGWSGNTVEGTAGNGTIATTGSGVFEWTGGTASNIVNIAPGSTWLISGPSTKDINSSSMINNFGNATWSGSGAIRGLGSSTLRNRAGGIFMAATDADFTNFSGSNRFRNDGVFTIGNPLGVTEMTWEYLQSSTGRLHLDVAGTTSNYDQLKISGPATLAGTISIARLNNYIPVPADSFRFVTFSSRTGTFETVENPGLILKPAYSATSLIFTAKADLENNLEWKQYFFSDPNSPDAQPLADPDGDGISNLQEYAFGLDPLSSTGSGITTQNSQLDAVTVGGVRYGSISFTRPAGSAALTDVNYVTETLRPLENPNWSSAGVVEHSRLPNSDGTVETVTLRSTQPMDQTRSEFMHVRISLKP